MDADTLSMAAGALLALGFAYVPGLAGWYDRLGEAQQDLGTRKRLVMLAALAVAAAAAFGLSCLRVEVPGVACSRAGAWGLVRAFALALAANQSAYLLAPRRRHPPASVKDGARDEA